MAIYNNDFSLKHPFYNLFRSSASASLLDFRFVLIKVFFSSFIELVTFQFYSGGNMLQALLYKRVKQNTPWPHIGSQAEVRARLKTDTDCYNSFSPLYMLVPILWQ